MRKRYFFIPLIAIIVISGILMWACKHPLGDGISFTNINNQGGGNGTIEEGGPGYKGEIGKDVTNTIIRPTQVEVFPYISAGNYYRIPTLIQLTNGDLIAFADKRKGTIGDLPNSIEVVMKR
ncbi:sialidase family protein, partial [Brachyspira catarrhinii]